MRVDGLIGLGIALALHAGALALFVSLPKRIPIPTPAVIVRVTVLPAATPQGSSRPQREPDAPVKARRVAKKAEPALSSNEGPAQVPLGVPDPDPESESEPRNEEPAGSTPDSLGQTPDAETDSSAPGEPALMDPDALRSACGSLSVPGRFLGQGFFPRRYRVSLKRPLGAGDTVPWKAQAFEPQASSLPFVDEALRTLVADECRFLPGLLAAALPSRFAAGVPGDVSFLIEFY